MQLERKEGRDSPGSPNLRLPVSSALSGTHSDTYPSISPHLHDRPIFGLKRLVALLPLIQIVLLVLQMHAESWLSTTSKKCPTAAERAISSHYFDHRGISVSKFLQGLHSIFDRRACCEPNRSTVIKSTAPCLTNHRAAELLTPC